MTSTAYNHCFLVIPIAFYLLWDRRAALVGVPRQLMPTALLLGVPLAAVWLVSERLGIMEGRQLAAVSFVEVLFLAMLGKRLWWAVAGPLLYLYFLVPFGEFLTPGLQDITTFFIRHGLEILGVPAYIDGYVIEIPQGTFFVAEACAGLRFLIASTAFGCLYTLLMYRSPLRRGVFILVSILVPIIANGLRAIGIVYLGYILGSAEAAAVDHILYGWIFFSLVILLLIALGLPFREDEVSTGSASRFVEAPADFVTWGFPGRRGDRDSRGGRSGRWGRLDDGRCDVCGHTVPDRRRARLRSAAGGLGRRGDGQEPARAVRRRCVRYELGGVFPALYRSAVDVGATEDGGGCSNRRNSGALVGPE